MFGETGAFGGVGSPFAAGALRSLAGSALTQGVAVVTGLQSRFDFAGVATAAFAGGVGAAAGRALQRGGVGGVGLRAGAATAGGIAGAAARSLVEGSSFGDNLIAALPDIIGQTVGGLIEDAAARQSAIVHRRRQAERLARDPLFANTDTAVAADFLARGRYDVDDLSRAALTDLRDVADVLTGASPLAFDPAYREQLIGRALTTVIGAPAEAIEPTLRLYREAGVASAPATGRSSGPVPIGLGDLVVTATRESGFAYGSLIDPALIGSGRVASYVAEFIGERSLLRFALIGLDVASGPAAFAVRQAIEVSPIGTAIQAKVDEASNYVAKQFSALDYSSNDARNAGVGAVTLATLAIGGATAALGALGRLGAIAIRRPVNADIPLSEFSRRYLAESGGRFGNTATRDRTIISP